MSIEDLETFLDTLEVEPPSVIEPTSVKELVGKREDIVAIAAQREIEDRFNNSISFDVQ
ncbi:hypothetical protein LCGC14_3130150, partial [marine sediment metagenome]